MVSEVAFPAYEPGKSNPFLSGNNRSLIYRIIIRRIQPTR